MHQEGDNANGPKATDIGPDQNPLRESILVAADDGAYGS